MDIRKAAVSDLESVLPIYSHARAYMKKTGNPNQWKDTEPSLGVIEKSIIDGNLYLLEDDDDIQGVFFFSKSDDETYEHIEGSWLNDKPYGVIHRVASAGRRSGILSIVLEYCWSRCQNLRIDTHKDNKIMQHLLEKNGFMRCGIIYLKNGEPRIAYQKC